MCKKAFFLRFAYGIKFRPLDFNLEEVNFVNSPVKQVYIPSPMQVTALPKHVILTTAMLFIPNRAIERRRQGQIKLGFTREEFRGSACLYSRAKLNYIGVLLLSYFSGGGICFPCIGKWEWHPSQKIFPSPATLKLCVYILQSSFQGRRCSIKCFVRSPTALQSSKTIQVSLHFVGSLTVTVLKQTSEHVECTSLGISKRTRVITQAYIQKSLIVFCT